MDTFRCLFAKRASKLSRNARFYKVFSTTFPYAPKRCFTKGFLVFCKVVKRHQALLISLIHFWYFSMPFCEKGPEVSRNDRFYKVFSTTFPYAPKRCFTKGFLVFCKVLKRHQVLLINPLLFGCFSMPFCERDPKSTKKRKVL